MKAPVIVAVSVLLVACTPSRPVVPTGQDGMVIDMTAFNKGQCDIVGPGIAVEKSVVLGGDYFKVVGNLFNSTIRCNLANGQTVISTSHHQFFDPQYNYAAIVIGRIRGTGEVEIYGYNDGPGGKVDVEGTFVFAAV